MATSNSEINPPCAKRFKQAKLTFTTESTMIVDNNVQPNTANNS